jgi:hypothetical protein
MRYNKNGTIALTDSEWGRCKVTGRHPNEIYFSPDIYTHLKFIKHLTDGALFEAVVVE